MPDDTPKSDEAATSGRDILEAFNAEEIVDRPGEPPAEDVDDASDTDSPPPG